MSSMNPPWEAGWPGRAGRRTATPAFGSRLRTGRGAHGLARPPEPPEGPATNRSRPGRALPPPHGRGIRPRVSVRAGPADSRDVAAVVADAPRAVTSAVPFSPWSRSSRGTATRSSRRSANAPAGSGGPARARSTRRSQLEDEGLVRTEKVEGRRVIHLTEAGTRHVEEHRAELDAVWDAASRDVDDDAAALWEQLAQLHAAAHQVMSAGTPEQITAAGPRWPRPARRSTACSPSRPRSARKATFMSPGAMKVAFLSLRGPGGGGGGGGGGRGGGGGGAGRGEGGERGL